MEPTGFFDIQIGAAEDGAAPGSAIHAYTVRLGWIHGEPYLIDLGSASTVLVNDTPLEPFQPVIIHDGDTITIGTTHLTWNAAARPAGSGEAPVEGSVPGPEPPSRPDGTLTGASEPGIYDPTLVVAPGQAKPPEPAAATAPGVHESTFTPQPGAPEPPAFPGEPHPGTHAPTLVAEPIRPQGTLGATPEDAMAYRTAWIDMAKQVDEEIDPDQASETIVRDTRVPHLVFHVLDRTWEMQLPAGSMTIGRGEENDVSLPEESVSNRHAVIERRGVEFLIRDAGSSNGVWLGKRRIEEYMLQDGDVLSLGRARLVFKGGFATDELTLIGTPRIDGKPRRRPVVVVPGLMGSELWLGSEKLWPNPKAIISDPGRFRLPGDPRIRARGIVNEVVIVPHIIEQRQYSALGDYLEAGLGYTRGKDLLEFAYDWRHDVRLAAQRLAETIALWQAEMPVTIIAHSLGTFVTRYYVEKLGGKRFVERVILMGGPHHGAPKGLAAVLYGPGILPFGLGAERMRQILATFPSMYQILPRYPCVEDQHGDHIDLLEDELWLPEQQRPYLRVARSFWRELGQSSSVPAVSVFGYGLRTKLRVRVQRRPDGLWEEVDFLEDTAGDRSVPSGSAVLKGSEIHPVYQDHGSLFVDDDVRMRLKLELTRSTTWQRR